MTEDHLEQEALGWLAELGADEALAETPALTSAGKVTVTISIGLVMLSGGGATRSLSHADEALYLAKNSGRNRVCVWES